MSYATLRLRRNALQYDWSFVSNLYVTENSCLNIVNFCHHKSEVFGVILLKKPLGIIDVALMIWEHLLKIQSKPKITPILQYYFRSTDHYREAKNKPNFASLKCRATHSSFVCPSCDSQPGGKIKGG